MRFGAHAFVWTADWNKESAEAAIRSAASQKLDFIEIPLLRPEELDVRTTVALLHTYGLSVTASLGLPKTAALPGNPKAAKSFLERALQTAHELGSPVLTGVIYGTLGELSGHPPSDRELDVLAKTLREVAHQADMLGMRLGIEPVNRYETYLVNLASQGLALIEAIGATNVFLHLDTYHMNIEEKGFREPIVQAGKRLGYIHLSESDRGTPGSGNVHWDDVFSGLREIGYQGDLVMESFVALNPDIARATCIWRPVASDPDRLVQDGLSFLKGEADLYGLA